MILLKAEKFLKNLLARENLSKTKQGLKMNEPFEHFWSLYPRRIAQKKAEQSWRQIPLYKHLDVVEGLKKHLTFWKQQGTDKQFIPYPATWLNQERWKDEIELAPEMPQCDWNRNGSRDVSAGRCKDQAVKENDGQFYCGAHCQRLGMKVVRG